jgi:hypothetical protein
VSVWLIGLLVWILPALILAPVLFWVSRRKTPSEMLVQDGATGAVEEGIERQSSEPVQPENEQAGTEKPKLRRKASTH